MDYSNERYVRVYTRKTADQAVLCWQARVLWPQIIMVADRAGIIATKHGARGLAALVDVPRDLVDAGLPELLSDGCVRVIAADRGYVIPNYLAAQEATSSDRQRKQEERERRHALAMAAECGVEVVDHHGPRLLMSRNVTDESRNVTSGHETGDLCHDSSQLVTDGHSSSRLVTPCLTVPSLTVPSRRARERQPKSTRTETALPEAWAPNDTHARIAREERVDLDRQANLFRDHAATNARLTADWDAAFRTWLRKANDFARSNTRGGHAPPELQRSLPKLG